MVYKNRWEIWKMVVIVNSTIKVWNYNPISKYFSVIYGEIKIFLYKLYYY